MAVYLFSRHPGAVEWAKRNNIQGRRIKHLTPGRIKKGVRDIGTIPIRLTAEFTEVGGTFEQIEMDVPLSMWGKELSADEMDACNARLVELRVRAVRKKAT